MAPVIPWRLWLSLMAAPLLKVKVKESERGVHDEMWETAPIFPSVSQLPATFLKGFCVPLLYRVVRVEGACSNESVNRKWWRLHQMHSPCKSYGCVFKDYRLENSIVWYWSNGPWWTLGWLELVATTNLLTKRLYKGSILQLNLQGLCHWVK